MKSPGILFSLAAAGALVSALLPQLRAQTTATTDPVGFVTIPLLANSDTLVSLPFAQPAVFTGAIGSISNNTITVASSPGWSTNQFVYVVGTQPSTYYAIIGPNTTTLTGTVTATNGSATLTGSGTTFTSQVAAGDEVLVDGLAYNVGAVASDTSLTLSDVYAGTTGSALTASRDHSPREGSYYTVIANGSNTLTVNLNGDTLSAVAAGTSVTVVPYWTLGTAFPASAANVSYVPSTSVVSRQTQILLPDLSSTGINLAPPVSYYYLNSQWCQAGASPIVSYNDTILPPASYFIVRNGTTGTTFTPVGGVYMNRETIPLSTTTSGSQDNAVGVTRPAGIALNDLGLISSNAFVASTSLFSRADQLLTYDNTVTGTNKSANTSYYYLNGAWREAGQSASTDFGATILPYGSGFTIRKAATANGATSFWQNTRNY